MRRKLILHIGHYKTGTTAIQVHLARARQPLRRAGARYAEVHRKHGKHSRLAFSLLRAAGARTLLHGYALEDPPEALWDALFAELRGAPEATTIVSTEEFMRLALFPQAVARLRAILAGAPDVDVRAIAYLRPPDAHLRSWHNQLVKMREATPRYDRAVLEAMEAIHYDPALALEPWIDLLGPDAVTLRAYRPEPGDPTWLLRDFHAAAGLPFDARAAAAAAATDPNPRLDGRTLELVRVLQNGGASSRRVAKQAGRYAAHLDREAAAAAAAADAFAALRARTAAGLRTLAARLPAARDALTGLEAELPRPEDDPAAPALRYVGRLLRENRALRARVAELEAAPAAPEPR